MQPTVPKVTITTALCCREPNNAEPVRTMLMPCELLVQMVVRSPFLLGLSHQTLTARMQALRAALPNADVQRMAQYSPSLLEVTTQDDPSSIMCCICMLSSAPNDAVVHAALETTCANSCCLSHGWRFTLSAKSFLPGGKGGRYRLHACMPACRDNAGDACRDDILTLPTVPCSAK